MGAGKVLAITGVTLGVLAAGAVVGDNVARGYAQDQVAERVQTELGLAQPPQVDLGGVPFSLALITRRVPTANLSATQVPLEVSGERITLETGDVVAEDLALQDDRLAIGSASGDGLLGYPALSRLAGVPVEAGEETGRVQVSYTAELFGQELVALVSAVPALDDERDGLVLTQTRISIAGFDLGEEVAQRIMDELVAPIEFELPYGLTPDSISADASGVRLAITAKDLVLPAR